MSHLSNYLPRTAGTSDAAPLCRDRNACLFIPANGSLRPLAGSKTAPAPKGAQSYAFRSQDLPRRSEWVVHRVAETDSTNRLLAELAAEGAPERTVVMADHQTAGKGKYERRWHSMPGKGLCASILLRPDRPVEELASVTLVIAVAVMAAIRHATGIPATVKWPNDILVNGRKLCGILCELVLTPEGEVSHIIAGIGLNENLAFEDFPHPLDETATSLAIECGHPVDRAASLANLLDELALWLGRWEREGFFPIRDAWVRHSCTLGRRVTLHAPGATHSGVAIGLGNDGSLSIRDDRGEIHTFFYGETRLPPFSAESAH